MYRVVYWVSDWESGWPSPTNQEAIQSSAILLLLLLLLWMMLLSEGRERCGDPIEIDATLDGEKNSVKQNPVIHHGSIMNEGNLPKPSETQ